jgi:phenylalanyl-tRNA synthetase beta chain
MLFSREWLGEYVDLPEDAGELAAGLTAVGLAVEGLEERAGDLVLDVDVTTNRPDCMNHLGLAREAAVHWGRELRLPVADLAEADEATAGAVAVELEEGAGCLRYVARVVRDVRIGSSPAWLERRLRAIGLRPINNVVDVTNFVLWETGQPLHAFDLARVAGGRIVVRRARAGERLTTLDGERRELAPEVLVIADAQKPVALAGVMGGLDSEVTAETTDVLLESAHFERRRVRAAARRFGLRTDASHRFERGADPGACAAAAERAASLLGTLGGGRVLRGAVDARAPEPASWPARGRLEHARLVAFAGAAIAPADVERWLGGLGFVLEREDATAGSPVWRVTAPSWRWYDMQPDAAGTIYEADLFEEVLRHLGFDRVPASLPAIPGSDGPRTTEQLRRDRVRDHLAACGWAEAVDYAFHAAEADAAFPSAAPAGAPAVAISNPLSERYALLRRSLLPNLTEAARFNLRRGAPAVRLFEIGHVFWRTDEGTVGERETVAVVGGGRVGQPWDREVELDLFDLKGVVETLGEVLGTELTARPAEVTGLLPGAAAELLADGAPAGVLGRLDVPDLPVPLYAAELATAPLGSGAGGRALALPSRFPSVAADLTLTHDVEVPWADIAAAVEAVRPPDLVSFGLEVRYTGEGVPAGAVNTTLTFLYGSPERSLTQQEVNERQELLRRDLERRFGRRGEES